MKRRKSVKERNSKRRRLKTIKNFKRRAYQMGASSSTYQSAKTSKYQTHTPMPHIIEPSAIEYSDSIEPSAIEYSDSIEPSAIEPSAIEYSAFEPSAFEPSAIEPSAVEPSAIEPSAIEPSELRERMQTQILRRFLKRNVTRKFADRMKAKFLNTICTDAGVCIAFGTAEASIKKFFNGFDKFQYATGDINLIGDPSENGVINEITYEREGYKAYAVLKSALSKTADNLMYEYRVGKYINTKLNQFPCFLETYGLYQNSKSQNIFKQPTKQVDALKNLIRARHIEWNFCQRGAQSAILIQHMKGIVGLNKINTWTADQLDVDFMGILIQIYMPLATMSNEFTHYDLHDKNVQLYVPIPGKYIQYHYHLDTGEILSFKSKYLVKILDYGRSYFKDTTEDSLKIYNDVCSWPVCGTRPRCGERLGFALLLPQSLPERHFISSSLNNVSHDLRLLRILISHSQLTTNSCLSGIRLRYRTETGTPEVKRTVDNTFIGGTAADVVNNVNDALGFLAYQYRSVPTLVAANEAYYNNPADLLGTMNVYHNADLTYVSADDRIRRFSRS